MEILGKKIKASGEARDLYHQSELCVFESLAEPVRVSVNAFSVENDACSSKRMDYLRRRAENVKASARGGDLYYLKRALFFERPAQAVEAEREQFCNNKICVLSKN